MLRSENALYNAAGEEEEHGGTLKMTERHTHASNAQASTIPSDPFESMEYAHEKKNAIVAEMAKVIIGHRPVIEQVLTAFFARGHCLLLGVPGLAKTLIVNTLAKTMSLDFHRM